MALGLQKLSAGSGYEYLTRQVAALDATSRGRTPLADYYTTRGEASGEWFGSGLADLGLQPGDPVTAEQMKLLFGAGLHPVTGARLGQRYALYANASTPFEVELGRRLASWLDDHELAPTASVPAAIRDATRTHLATEWFESEFGRRPSGPRELHGYIARSTSKPRVAVAGFDLTFSPAKSISALWALADRPLSAEIRAAHDAAVADALAFVEKRVLFTRRGHDGVRQVDVRGLIAATFVHRDSRAGDPDLHTHVAVANKVQALDGAWLAIDGRVLYAAKVGASETYTTSLQARLTALGLTFVPTGRDGRRPVYEIVGMDARLLARWSSRRGAIERRMTGLVAAFEADHERPPTASERLALAQRATLETRPDKHGTRSEAEQRRTWRSEADALLGRRSVDRMLREVVQQAPASIVVGTPSSLGMGGRSQSDVLPARPRGRSPAHGLEAQPSGSLPDADWVEAVASVVITTIESQQATWQEWHVRAEALRQVRAAAVPLAGVDMAVDAIVERALAPDRSVRIAATRVLPTEPAALRRRDGSSMYEVAGSGRFTSTRILDAERRLIASAGQRGGRAVDGNSVAVALLQSLANGVALNAGQRALVQELATSGRRLQLAIAPAGTGKTTAMRALAAAWTNAGGDVLGLAPSASAAEQLGRQLDARSGVGAGTADTLAKLAWAVEHGESLAERVGPGTLVVVDEAGMADTLTLDRVVGFCLARGASVRLVGDDRQLSAVGAGGVLRDIAAAHGTVRLDEAVRFASRAEAEASLALRSGDAGALGFYLDRGRVHVADAATASGQVLNAWLADVRAGRDALMLAPTRVAVAELNAAAQRALLGVGSGRRSPLADGNLAGVGDLVLTRQNDRSLVVGEAAWVRNGERWRVEGVRRDGGLEVRSARTGARLTLPAAYVAASVELGYATTIHGAQGVTADVCHGLVTGAETRQQLYTLLSRGRLENHVWVECGQPDAHVAPIARDLVDAPSATDVLERIVATDDAAPSASSLMAAADDPAVLLGSAVACYVDAVGVASESVLDASDRARVEFAGRLFALSDADAWPALRTCLARAAADGRDPVQEVLDAVAYGSLDGSRDRAAVVERRLEVADANRGGRGPLEWLPGVPTRVAETPEWRDYLEKRSVLVGELAAEVRARVFRGAAGRSHACRGESHAVDSLAWAAELDLPRSVVADVQVWRAAHRVPDADLRPTGPARRRAPEARVQHRLDAQIEAADATGNEWSKRVAGECPELAGDPGLPKLGRRLASLAAEGVNAEYVLAVALKRPLPDDHAADAVRYRIAEHEAASRTEERLSSGPADYLGAGETIPSTEHAPHPMPPSALRVPGRLGPPTGPGR